jgi:hypothetical protein
MGKGGVCVRAFMLQLVSKTPMPMCLVPKLVF